jgi:pimeloyl-ACP methyl ester carboxylesterase
MAILRFAKRTLRLLRLLGTSALSLHALDCVAAEQPVKLGGMDVVVWDAPGVAGSQPVSIFSHGFHGCATQSRFLMEALAAAGYRVFAPNHRDATCHGGGATWGEKSTIPFREVERWNESSYRDRADDIRRLIEAIRTDQRYAANCDLSRLALVGHSLGGYTVLGLAGAWPAWKLDGVKAVIAWSPYSQPFAAHKTQAGLAAPVMYQSGTWDLGVNPTMRRSMGSYDQSPQPKYYVEFDKIGHFAWTDAGRSSARAPIVAYSVSFLDHYVKGEAADRHLTRSAPGVAVFHYASELGSK